jgi:hypothetical protein
MEHVVGWDPFFTFTGSPNPSSLLLCVYEEQASFWRVCGGTVEKHMVHLVGRHATGQLTCATLARQLSTIFIGTASGNILAFPARVERERAGTGGQDIQNK